MTHAGPIIDMHKARSARRHRGTMRRGWSGRLETGLAGTCARPAARSSSSSMDGPAGDNQHPDMLRVEACSTSWRPAPADARCSIEKKSAMTYVSTGPRGVYAPANRLPSRSDRLDRHRSGRTELLRRHQFYVRSAWPRSYRPDPARGRPHDLGSAASRRHPDNRASQRHLVGIKGTARARPGGQCSDVRAGLTQEALRLSPNRRLRAPHQRVNVAL